jgi:hypothetical protein
VFFYLCRTVEEGFLSSYVRSGGFTKRRAAHMRAALRKVLRLLYR